jgi:folate-binding protein YgfZ
VSASDVERLYEVAHMRGVVVDRTGRGLLRVTGLQAVWFLQQTITADVDDLPSGAWRESAFLTPKGKLLAHFRVGRVDDDLWLDVDPPHDALVEWLVKYRFRTKVEIEDRSTSVATIVGPAAAELAAPDTVAASGGTIVFGSRLGGVNVADVHGSFHGDLEAAPLDVLEIFRIEAGVGRFGVDYTTDHLPQEAGLTSIVPVDKGCYVGQETVARIHFRGHVNRVVRPLRLVGIEPGAAIGEAVSAGGQRLGAISSAAHSPRNGPVAIGMVRVEPPAGAEVEIEGGGTAILGAVPTGTKIRA